MKNRVKAILGGTSAAAIIGAGALLAVPAEAATNVEQIEHCTDGGGVIWTGKVLWVGTYIDSNGVKRAKVDFAGWTTKANDPVPTDSQVKSYNRSGTLIQTLTRTAETDYVNGTFFDHRNPRNPRAGDGRALIQIKVGRDGDGYGDCVMRFFQPINLGSVSVPQPTPTATGTPTVKPSETVTQTPSATPSQTVTQSPSATPSTTVTPSASASASASS